MRAKFLAGFAAIAVAAPLCAQADNVMVFNKPDLWYSGPGRADAFKLPDIVRTGAAPAATDAHSDSTVANIRETRTIRAVDTEMGRVAATKTATRAAPRSSIVLPRDLMVAPRDTVSPAVRTMSIARVMASPAVPTTSTMMTSSGAVTHAATAAPEMSSGLAATGLTLLLGGISVLRSRRTRSSA